MDFRVDDVEVGKAGKEVPLESPAKVRVSVRVAAWLEPNRTAETEQIRCRPLSSKPYWHVERARIERSRNVPLELIVNGRPVARQTVMSDGVIRQVTFDLPIERSSWVALRIYPAAHTNPIFVLVGGKPVRASKESAEWCLRCVDQSWEKQSPRMSVADREQAAKAYEHAREIYRQIIAQST